MDALEVLGTSSEERRRSRGAAGDGTDGERDPRMFWQARVGSRGGDAKAKSKQNWPLLSREGSLWNEALRERQARIGSRGGDGKAKSKK